MGSKPIAPEIRQRYKNTIEECLRDGYDPYRAIEKRGKGSAVEEAVRRLVALGFDTTRNKLQAFVNIEEKRASRGEENYSPDWNLFAPPGLAYTTTAKPSGKIRRWILTSAQDDTDFHPKFWNNIQAFASALNAQISISGFTYQTMRHTDRAALTNTYRKELRPFLRFESMDCGPVLWCAEMNILPTAVKPLSGMEGYSRGRDAVFPHAKSQMTTIPQAMGDHVPVLLTTGAVTVTNYIPKKAGQKAKFHHNFGFVLVEVDGNNRAWITDVHASPDGSFQFHDLYVNKGIVNRNKRVEALVHGDIHLPYIDKGMISGVWGDSHESMINTLRPKFQFFHDLYDFAAYNRHVEGDHFHHVKMDVEGQLSVPDHIRQGVEFLLGQSKRDFCQSIMVKSNHDARFDRWASKALPVNTDIENSIFWHECRVAQLNAIKFGDKEFDMVLWAMRRFSENLSDSISFVPRGGSFEICQDSGGVECGWHGDLGPNGQPPSPTSYAKMAKRIVRAHTHSPSTLDGLTTAGVLGNLDQGYNVGPSNWKHSSVIVYPDGKRSHVFLTVDGKWRA